MNMGFEIIVFGQILPHKIGVSDLRSPNSQIQFLYTPNTMPIKDGLTVLFCCCCFSHSAHWLPTRKKLFYTVANPARGLLNREKK